MCRGSQSRKVPLDVVNVNPRSAFGVRSTIGHTPPGSMTIEEPNHRLSPTRGEIDQVIAGAICHLPLKRKRH
jgi:hypothetical protein